jgi:hypothetical protein
VKYKYSLSIRFLNSLGHDARFSHIAIIEAKDLTQYYHFIEEIRDCELLSQGYLRINRILIGYEDGYPQFEQQSEASESLVTV